ncbi:MAG: pilus assembly protein TadG-related protein, partial [Pirellulaceae bacterium]|nr:pilus assembly protein TadG-related protein [Pirellulaceae bacterium]
MKAASFFSDRVLRPMVAQRSLITRVHRDQEGSISIVSVFGLMLLVFLLGLVMNAGRQVDQKVKMQNAADSATYAGGVVVGRGMNTLAFTNHLMSDVFAIT